MLAEQNPLDFPAFFSSPIETLLESLEDSQGEHVTLHDLVEAYTTLSTRIRAIAKALLEVRDPKQPALQPLQTHSRELHQCLSRDIQRAAINPLSHPRSDWTMLSYTSKSDVAPQELQNSKDLTNVCHHALQVVASVFTLPPLISIFSDEELANLLHELLALAKRQHLPTPSHMKTRIIVLWIIQTQRLPTEILIDNTKDIKSIFDRSIDDIKDPSQASRDSLKGINNLLRGRPQNLVDSFTSFLEPTLRFLCSKSFEHRLDAANVLSSFAGAKIQHQVMHVSETSTEFIRSYIDGQVSKDHEHDQNRLPKILSDAISTDKGKGPRWPLTVVACLVALSDYSLFLHPKSLKLVLNTLMQLRQSKREIARTEHSLLWRCLIWAFSRIPRNSADPKLENTRKKAFNVVHQELTHGIGAALASVLLSDIPPDGDPALTASDILLVLEIPKNLISGSGRSTSLEGLALLNRMIDGSSQTHTSADDQLLFPPALVDGTLLKLKTADDVKAIVKPLGCFPLHNVRSLTQDEIIYHWDDIIDIWKCAAEKALVEPEPSIPEDIFNIWKTLLLLHSYLVQRHPELTSSFKLCVRAASIIAGFAIRGESARTEITSLSFMRSLWLEMRSVFKACSLSSHAEIILAKIMEREFNLMNDRVRNQWSLLASDLVAEGIPTLLHILHVKRKREDQVDATRELWAILGSGALVTTAEGIWENIVSFLCVPIGAWTLTNFELDVWKDIFHKAINAVKKVNIEKHRLVTMLIKSLNHEKDCFSKNPDVVLILLQEISAEQVEQIPAQFFQILGLTFQEIYGNETQLATAKTLYQYLGNLFSLSPPKTLVRVLVLLQEGLCLWLKDERNILMDDDYNMMVQKVYCDALDILSSMEPSVEVLTTLSSFFMSVFFRIPPPGLGPLAFEKYWQMKCQGQREIVANCPAEILIVLKAWGDCCSKNVAGSFSFETVSQIAAITTVTDSQIWTQPQEHLPVGDNSGHHPSISEDDVVGETQETPRGIVHEHGGRDNNDSFQSSILPPTPEPSLAKAEQNIRKWPNLYDDAVSPKRRKTAPSVPSATKSRLDDSPMRRTKSTIISAYQNFISPSTPNPTSDADRFADATISEPHYEHKGASNSILDSRCSSPSSDDYRMWEAGVSDGDIENIQLQLQRGSLPGSSPKSG